MVPTCAHNRRQYISPLLITVWASQPTVGLYQPNDSLCAFRTIWPERHAARIWIIQAIFCIDDRDTVTTTLITRQSKFNQIKTVFAQIKLNHTRRAHILHSHSFETSQFSLMPDRDWSKQYVCVYIYVWWCRYCSLQLQLNELFSGDSYFTNHSR